MPDVIGMHPGYRSGWYQKPKRSGLAALWLPSRAGSVTAATDGTGAAPTDGGVIGRINDLSGNGYYLLSSADAARKTWYQNGMQLGSASIHSTNSATDLYNNTGLSSLFSGTNPSFAVFMLTARRLETRGSTAYIWGVLKNAGTIGVGSGNPAFTLNPQNGIYSASRPWIVSGYARDADTSLQSGQAFDDTPASGIGYGSSSIICYTLVKSGQTSKVYQNGHLVSTATQTSGNFTFGADGYFTVGGLYNGTTRTGCLDGHWYGGAVLDHAPTDADRMSWEAYFLRMVGVAYSSEIVATPRKWWWNGHSMFVTNAATVPTPPFLIQQKGRLPWDETICHVNRSVSNHLLTQGGASNDMGDSWVFTSTTAATVKSGDFVVLRCPTNDCAAADDTSNATMEAAMDALLPSAKAIIDDAITETDRFLYLTDPPRNDDTAVVAHGVNYFRQIARTLCGRYDRVVFVDSYDALDDGSEGLLAAYDSSDGLHLNKAGYEIEADMLASAATHLRDCNPTTHTNLVRWYSGRGQTSTLADADAMSAIVDLSSTADNAAQATGADQPTFRIGTSTSNYKATSRFDGASDFASFTRVNLSAWTLILANKYDTSGGGHILGDTVSSPAVVVRYLADGTLSIRDTSGTTVTFTPRYTLLDYDVIVINSSGQCWVNGVAASVSGAFAGNLALDTIGNQNVSFFKGDLGDVLIYDAVLTKRERDQHGKYIAYKYGKTWDRSGGARA